MQQFVLEKYLNIVSIEVGDEMEVSMLLDRDYFIAAMLRMHASEKGTSNLSLYTNVQNVENYRFWVYEAGQVHRIPEMV